MPVVKKCKSRLALHPDDPPVPLLGLPKIVCTEDDVDFILRMF